MLQPLLLALQVAAGAGAQPDSALPLVHHGRSGQTRVPPPRIEADLVVDGALDEPVWAQAARLTGFSQFSPSDGVPAADSTEVLVWYSPTAIHFGVRAFEAHGAVRATLADRDAIGADDHVQLLLSTFNDGRQAAVFAVNPYGVQMDGTLVETGRTGGGFSGGAVTFTREPADLSPDFVFQSKGRLVPGGYEIEVRIPFKSLRFQSGAAQTWGINVTRRVQHSGHEDTWAPARRASASFLGQSGQLTGLSGLRRGLVVDLTPEVTASVTGAPALGGTEWDYAGGEPQFGGTARWGITNNLTLNGTVNPDFSQVESDAGQFTFDPRQAIFFGEKRPFFLEGIEQFATPNNLVYTRRIVQPVGAVKLAGKAFGTDLALISAVDDQAASVTGDDHPVFNIVRLQRDVGRASRLGLVYTDRIVGGDYNRVAGIDGRIVLGGIYSFQFQGAGSRTRTGDAVSTAPLWNARILRSGRIWRARAAINGIAEDFRAQSGFISRPGIVNANVSNTLTRYGKQGALLEQLSGELVLDGTWQYANFVNGGGIQDRKLHVNLNGLARGGWRAGASVLIEDFGYDEGLYADYFVDMGTDTVAYVGTPRLPNLDWVVSFGTPETKYFSASGFYLWGQDENFFEWSSSDIKIADIGASVRPTDKLRLDLRYQHQQFDRKDGSTVAIRRLPRVKMEYQVARPLFVRLIGEYDAAKQDSLRDDGRTNRPVLICDPGAVNCARAGASESNTFRGDVLVAYQPVPGTVFFAGYGSTLQEPEAMRFRRLRRLQDGFFLKLSYLFRL